MYSRFRNKTVNSEIIHSHCVELKHEINCLDMTATNMIYDVTCLLESTDALRDAPSMREFKMFSLCCLL
jgi:hypothetical protein